jgi:dihydroorotate dehydrogenase (NAD+) catalytic subunit
MGMSQKKIDMSVNLGGLKMLTPIATASGTFGYGTEYTNFVDYSKLGAVTAKGVKRFLNRLERVNLLPFLWL